MIDNKYVIECEDLGRVYASRSLTGNRRETVALEGLSLGIEGGVFGLLGPNGAGKTTTIRILSTLLTPTTGSARVLGFDVEKQAKQVRRRIGLVLGGDRGLYGRLTGKENLLYFAALHHMSTSEARRRAAYYLDLVGLSGRGDSPAEQYSRGMKQRLHLARGLLTDPSVLFLDEPTIGLDPVGAQEVRQLIQTLANDGKTILLTTHYMFEADQLCDTIGLINHGKLVNSGSPTEIKQRFSGTTVQELTVKPTRGELTEELSRLDGVERVDSSPDGLLLKFVVQTRAGVDLSDQLISVIGAENVVSSVTRDPTLEEAYINVFKE